MNSILLKEIAFCPLCGGAYCKEKEDGPEHGYGYKDPSISCCSNCGGKFRAFKIDNGIKRERELRKPDANGVLPLTDEEKVEFADKFNHLLDDSVVTKMVLSPEGVDFIRVYGRNSYNLSGDFKSMKWILDRFKLFDMGGK